MAIKLTCSARNGLFVAAMCVALLGVAQSGSTIEQQPDKTGAQVLIWGTGPSPYTETVVDELVDFLKAQGVSIEGASRQVRSREDLIEAARTSGAESALYVVVDIAAQMQSSLDVQCFGVDGERLWEEMAKSGPLSFSGSGDARKLLKKLKKRITPHVGKPGLPRI